MHQTLEIEGTGGGFSKLEDHKKPSWRQSSNLSPNSLDNNKMFGFDQMLSAVNKNYVIFIDDLIK
jgi:hypothetical protein